MTDTGIDLSSVPRREGAAAPGRATERTQAQQRPGGTGRTDRDRRRVVLLGLVALGFSALYFLSDAIEVVQGGFSVGQLWLTLAAEAAIPVFVVGLAMAQRPHLDRVGWVSAWAYAYSFVYFAGTVVYALVGHVDTYSDLSEQLGPAMLVHGAVMAVAGVGFGAAVLHARVLPRWTGWALMAGVVLVVLTQTMPPAVGLVAAATRDLAFAGMGASLLLRGAARPPLTPAARTAVVTPRLRRS